MGDALPFLHLPGKAKRVRAGFGFACALLESEQLVCWGDNYYGQIGQSFALDIGDDPLEMSVLSPIDLGTGRTVVDFDLGFYQACALLDNGDLKCWGSGDYGENGSGKEHNIGTSPGDMGDRLAPIDFGDRKVLQIALPGYSSCALLDSNELVCWGDDDYGESATPGRYGGPLVTIYPPSLAN